MKEEGTRVCPPDRDAACKEAAEIIERSRYFVVIGAFPEGAETIVDAVAHGTTPFLGVALVELQNMLEAKREKNKQTERNGGMQ